MTIYPSNIKILNYKFTPDEVHALYRLILYMGWIPNDDEEINDVVNHICKIAQTHDVANRIS